MLAVKEKSLIAEKAKIRICPSRIANYGRNTVQVFAVQRCIVETIGLFGQLPNREAQ